MEIFKILIQPHEKEYVLSRENLKIQDELLDALAADDVDKVDQLIAKTILPLKLLKHLGKEFVLQNGLPTITAEIVNDTDWLK